MATPEASTPYDLTQTLGSFMDRHLLVPLLNFLATKGLYDKRELDEAKMQLIFGTNMVDDAMDIYKELHSTQKVPEEYTKRREEVRGAAQIAFPRPLRCHPWRMHVGPAPRLAANTASV